MPEKTRKPEQTQLVGKRLYQHLLKLIDSAENPDDFEILIDKGIDEPSLVPIFIAIARARLNNDLEPELAVELAGRCVVKMRSLGIDETTIQSYIAAARATKKTVKLSREGDKLCDLIDRAANDGNFHPEGELIFCTIYKSKLSREERKVVVGYLMEKMGELGVTPDELVYDIEEALTSEALSSEQVIELIQIIWPDAEIQKQIISRISEDFLAKKNALATNAEVNKALNETENEAVTQQITLERENPNGVRNLVVGAITLTLAGTALVLSLRTRPEAISEATDASNPSNDGSVALIAETKPQQPLIAPLPKLDTAAEETTLMSFPLSWRTNYRNQKILDLKATIKAWNEMGAEVKIGPSGKLQIIIKLKNHEKPLYGMFDPGSICDGEAVEILLSP